MQAEITDMSGVQKILIGVGAYFLLREIAFKAGYSIADNLQYDFEGANVRYSLQDIQHVYIDIGMRIQNNNPIGGRVQRFDGELFYSNARLGEVQMLQPFEIGPGESRRLDFTARISIAQLPGQIQNLISSGEVLGSVRIKGMLQMADVNIPIDQNIPIL